VVDLDAPATTRWKHIVAPLASEIANMTDVVVTTLRKVLGSDRLDGILDALDADIEAFTSRLPRDYGVEILGIAAATDIKPAILFVYNIFYTLMGACTSIVGQNDGGEIFHGSNLDFGIWPSFDIKPDHSNFWKLTEKLRPIVFNVDFQRDGATLYKATTYGGFIGALRVMKPNAFALTVDTRFDMGLDGGLIAWLLAGDLKDRDMDVTWLARDVMENRDAGGFTTYDDALVHLKHTKTIGPAYIIFSGTKPGEGAVISKGKDVFSGREGETVDVWTLAEELAKKGGDGAKDPQPFLVETNYDHWKSAPKFDNRRDPAIACMRELGTTGTSIKGIYRVLTAMPNLNYQTTFTTVMHTAAGHFESFRQQCADPKCGIW
jgi:acid ceramidase